eukprot:TRINITY_DN4855_c0_g1_i1.p1 TRINITY_DN4855_c0_g1~~TRINITY_DN4855_c0_g1_i1.p1  ORF type:complete len:406 (-),score=54.14 TRINITY_DN4855_c0_g1_i1:94-1311(-)
MDKVHTSALVVIPPESLWPKIQQIRKKHDKAYFRWMPHINLLYPFVPQTAFSEAATKIKNSLASSGPFELTFNTFDFFEHGPRSSTVYLKPETQPPDALISLEKSLVEIFPHCDDLITRSSDGFKPHLTVGQFPGSSLSKNKIEQFMKPSGEISWNSITFTVDSIHLISRSGIKPFSIIETVPLMGGMRPTVWVRDLSPAPALSNSPPAQPNVSILESAFQESSQPVNIAPPPVIPIGDRSTLKDPKEIALFRVKNWLKNPKHRIKLPKSKSKFISAISPFCHVRIEVLPVETAYTTLRNEGLFVIDNSKKVKFTKKVPNAPAPYLSSSTSYTDTSELSSECLERCRYWATQPGNAPKTEEAVKNCLKSLCQRSVVVDGNDIVEELVNFKFMTLDDYGDQISYNL